MAPEPSTSVDVFICGAGPVGTVLALQLQRMGISTYLAEAALNADNGNDGRAAVISPRTLELLSQLDLADALFQQGFVCKQTVTFRDGLQVHGRGWGFVTNITNTFFEFILHLRPTYTQDILRRALSDCGGRVHHGSRLVSFSPCGEQGGQLSRYNITCQNEDGITTLVKAQYIIGADGGKSIVRNLAGIEFVGDSTPSKWVILDAIINTDMPSSRIGPVSIETKDHGNVLWAPVDHGRTRIVFPFTSRMQEKYGDNWTQADMEAEAILALKPFKVYFETLDSWTVHSARHRLAESYFVPQSSTNSSSLHDSVGIFLAGDAAHTHSSATAQGMNAGIHDVTNLAWKLAGAIKGWYDRKILATYELERRPVAATIIESDRLLSSCMSGKVPESWVGLTTDPNEIFGELLDRYAQHTIGLGLHYGEDGLLNRTFARGSIPPGDRAPDISLYKAGSLDQIRLYSVMQNTGRFWILVFGYHPLDYKRPAAVNGAAQSHRKAPKPPLQGLREYLDKYNASGRNFQRISQLATIFVDPACSVDTALGGIEPFGNVYYSVRRWYERYGVHPVVGQIVIIRPDGIVGATTFLEHPEVIGEYFEKFVLPEADHSVSPTVGSRPHQGID